MRHLVLLLLLATAPGCATFIDGGTTDLPVTTDPPGAHVTVTNEAGAVVFEGTTPTKVNLDNGDGYFDGETYRLAFSKAGYPNREFVLRTRASNWYLWGNIVIGGLIGWLIVDPLTGAMWTFEWERVDIVLETGAPPAEPPTAEAPQT